MMSQEVRIPTNRSTHIRRLDPVRDMLEVLNLIELGFRSELDPQGWKMLKQMRRVYSPGNVTQAICGRAGDTKGLVWEQEGKVVGNLSLRHASPRSSSGQLIGNVVVHPEHQGHGIGRALMENALHAARNSGARWVGLEVRANNVVARTLYEHLGFRVAGTTEHLIRPEGLKWPKPPNPDRKWRRATSKDSGDWKRLTAINYTDEQRLILEIREEIFQDSGLERRLNLWFHGKQEKAWVHQGARGDTDLIAHLEIEKRYGFYTWDILMHPELDASASRELIARCLAGTRGLPTWPVTAIVPQQGPLAGALRHAGFEPHRTLLQMILDF